MRNCRVSNDGWAILEQGDDGLHATAETHLKGDRIARRYDTVKELYVDRRICLTIHVVEFQWAAVDATGFIYRRLEGFKCAFLDASDERGLAGKRHDDGDDDRRILRPSRDRHQRDKRRNCERCTHTNSRESYHCRILFSQARWGSRVIAVEPPTLWRK